MKGSPTSAQAIEALRRDGFVVLEGVLDPTAIDAHLRRVAPTLLQAAEDARRELGLAEDLSDAAAWRQAAASARGREIIRPAFGLDPSGEGAREIVFSPALHALAAEAFAAPPVFWHGGSFLFPRSASQGEEQLHADYAASAAPAPWTDGLRFWCALEDIDPRSGPFLIYRASHRLVTPKVMADVLRRDPALAAGMKRQLQADTQEAWLPVFSELHRAACDAMTAECLAQGLERVVFTLGKGDVVAFNPATVHGTALTLDEGCTRKALTFDLLSRNAEVFLPRAWWGALHDHRHPANRISFEVERTPWGMRVADWPAALAAAHRRPVAARGLAS